MGEHRGGTLPLLLLCLSVALFGCAIGPDISRIEPELCVRQTASVGDQIVAYTVGSTRLSLYDYTVRSGAVYYDGMDGSSIAKFRGIPSGPVRIDLRHPEDAPGQGWIASNNIGENGEVYIQWDSFYIVVYAASPEHLDYALQELDNTFSVRPIPCPETQSLRA